MSLIDPNATIAPGVRGYTVDMGERGIYVPLIGAIQPGNGDVGRYLDGLAHDRRVVVPNVLSGRLEGMLKRRGFTLVEEWAEDFGEYVPCWERKP